jgi:hypothetical protein
MFPRARHAQVRSDFMPDLYKTKLTVFRIQSKRSATERESLSRTPQDFITCDEKKEPSS